MFREADIKKRIEKKIKRLENPERFRRIYETDALIDSFYNKLYIRDYTKSKKKRALLLKQCIKIAEKVPELKGWPKDPNKFWEIESFNWNGKIEKDVRNEIAKQLPQNVKNLSLGSGSYSYIKNSTLVDFSESMLKNAPKGKKVICNLDKEKLPFKDNSFDTVTMAFLLNYLKDPKKTIKEAKRVAKNSIFIIQSKKPLDEMYQIQEKTKLTLSKIKELLKGFEYKQKNIKIGKRSLLLIEAKVFK